MKIQISITIYDEILLCKLLFLKIFYFSEIEMRRKTMDLSEFVLFTSYLHSKCSITKKDIFSLYNKKVSGSKLNNSFEFNEKRLSIELKKNNFLRLLFSNEILDYENEHLYFNRKFLPISYKEQCPLDDLIFQINDLDYNYEVDSFIVASILDQAFEDFYKNEYQTKNEDKSVFIQIFCIVLTRLNRVKIKQYLEIVQRECNRKRNHLTRKSVLSYEVVTNDNSVRNETYSDISSYSQRRDINPFDLKIEQINKCVDSFKSASIRINDTTFAQDVIKYCYLQGINKGVDFENETFVSQNIYSQMKNDKYTVPNKRICISICVGLRLTLEESKLLLYKAGYALSNQIAFDRFVIENSLSPKFYDIQALNDLIDSINEKEGEIVIKEKLGSIERGSYSHSNK